MTVFLALLVAATCIAQQRAYSGFDRNEYPGDASLAALRKSFQFTGYWLSNPPGALSNSWTGKRTLLREKGFGFLVLFNGRTYAELKGNDASALGTADGSAAVAAARREGFPKNVLIFLDQEEGGRMLPEQAAYLFAWADAVRAGGARAGVYCSGIDVPEGKGKISTARDIVERETARAKGAAGVEHIKLWIANDQCPPSPGCSIAAPRMGVALASTIGPDVVAWQYAQSPRRMQFTAACPANYARDGECYAPGLARSPNSFIDMNTADSADPSSGR